VSEPRNLTLERVNRLTQAVADLIESHAAQGRAITRLLEQISTRLAAIEGTLVALDKSVRDLSGEQVLLGNRVEEAFARALRVNLRLDEMEE
jgi:hypothetical protein